MGWFITHLIIKHEKNAIYQAYGILPYIPYIYGIQAASGFGNKKKQTFATTVH